MSLKKIILKENINRDIIEFVVDIIESNLSLELEDISNLFDLIGAGLYAKVYSIEQHKDKVLRIEDDLYESFFVDIAGADLENVVKVFYSDIIPIRLDGETTNVEITVMEKLEPLDSDEQKMLNHIGLDGLPSNWSEVSFLAVDGVEHILSDIFNGLDELDKMGIYLNDLHSGNVMYDPKTNKYKIIDLSNV